LGRWQAEYTDGRLFASGMEERGLPKSRQGRFIARDWTQGSIIGNLLSLSWPLVISSSLMMLGPTIDMVWVGKLGSASVAGVGVAGIATQLIMGAMMGLIMGMRALIARFIGTNDIQGANHVSQQAFVISGGFAIIMAVVGAFLAEEILGLFGLEPEVVVAGSDYLRIMFVGAAAISFRIMAEGVMQASGDTVTPMITATIYRLFHVALCPFLIFGWWIFPELGVRGAAVTNVISQSLGVSLGLWLLFTGRSLYFTRPVRQDEDDRLHNALSLRWLPRIHIGQSRLRLTMQDFRLDPHVIWRIVRIGLPSMISGMQRTFSQFFLMMFISPFGTVAVAAHTITQRIEILMFMPGMAMGQAAGVLAGQNLGAGKPERAAKGAWIAVLVVEAFLIICSIVILFVPGPIVRIFNSEPDLVAMTTTFLRIAVTGYVVMGITASLMSTLSGAGDTVPPMIFGLISIWVFQLPLAYFLPKIGDLGVYGVRWAIVSGLLFGAVAYLLYFRTGRWKRRRV